MKQLLEKRLIVNMVIFKMKILETRADFTGQINPGRYCFIIVIDKKGINISIDELVSQAIHFPRIVIQGEEPFEQRGEMEKLIRKVIKKKPEMIIEIFTNGVVRPIGIGNFSNIIYNVCLQLKNSGLKIEDRLKEDAIKWYNDISGNFLFYIRNEDDIDEVQTIIQKYEIGKSQVFLMCAWSVNNKYELLRIIISKAKLYGYNFSFNMFKWLKRGEVENED